MINEGLEQRILHELVERPGSDHCFIAERVFKEVTHPDVLPRTQGAVLRSLVILQAMGMVSCHEDKEGRQWFYAKGRRYE